MDTRAVLRRSTWESTHKAGPGSTYCAGIKRRPLLERLCPVDGKAYLGNAFTTPENTPGALGGRRQSARTAETDSQVLTSVSSSTAIETGEQVKAVEAKLTRHRSAKRFTVKLA